MMVAANPCLHTAADHLESKKKIVHIASYGIISYIYKSAPAEPEPEAMLL